MAQEKIVIENRFLTSQPTKTGKSLVRKQKYHDVVVLYAVCWNKDCEDLSIRMPISIEKN